MAVKSTHPIKIPTEKLLAFVPLLLQIVIALFFLIVVIVPLGGKIYRLSNEIREKNNQLTLRERTNYDLTKLKKELSILEGGAAEYDRRLPAVVETNMLLDSFKAVTRETKLKFTSIEPMESVEFALPGTADTYYELPIRIKLQCGFFELVDFISRIESNKERLMKVRSLAIKTNPENSWNHNVEIVISNFARARKGK
jgi:Tfp pilus assembly protein PilO